MPGKKRSRKSAAKKGAATRKRNQEIKKRAAAKRKRERERELRKIEKLLGEDFTSLAQARAALKTETVLPAPSKVDINTVDEYEHYYSMYEDVDYEMEDQGEYGSGVDTGEAS
jgi:hypothetical protein